MKIINTINRILDIYSSGSFDIDKWKGYIRIVNPNLEQLCIDDMYEAINTGQVTYDKDYLPVLNSVIKDINRLEELNRNFNTIIKELENKIVRTFGKTLNVEVILYLGLCNGAGWVVTIADKTYCLLGVEKIIELEWFDLDSLYGLIYHELGHIYQNQYGVLERTFDNNKHKFLWQLFTEGIAMYFEQLLVGDFNYYHQDKNGWKSWCDNNLNQIKNDFYIELENMTFKNQRYFGDLVFYKGHYDVGYYLGTRFVQYICSKYPFEDILSFNIDIVEKLFIDWLSL